MRKRVNLCLSLCLFYLLSLGSTALAAENTSVIPGLGTLSVPANIEILPLHINSDKAVGNTLLVNDNETWRSVNIIFAPNASPDRKMLKVNSDFLDASLNVINTRLVNNQNARLLSSSPLDNSALDNELNIIKTAKFLIRGGFTMRTDFYLLNGTNGLVLMTVISSDSDSSYWKPIIAKMIVDIKR